VTHKIVSEMTYNVSSGTLNCTIPYLSLAGQIACHGVNRLSCHVSGLLNIPLVGH